LHKYTAEDIVGFIRGSPLCAELEGRGMTDWYIEFDLHDSFSHFIYLRRRSEPDRRRLIGFMIVQLSSGNIADLDLLSVRWLSLQDVNGSFSARRPRLPGQRYPGSGLARSAFGLVYERVVAAGRDGILNRPEHFHNACFYRDPSKLGSKEGFRFWRAADEGWFSRLLADLARDLRERGLAAVSWAIYLGFLRCGDAQERWVPRDQVFAISPKCVAHFTAAEFTQGVTAGAAAAGPFSIVWDEAEKMCLGAIIELGDLSPDHSRK
jgi:hypothetical protein